MSAAEKPDAAWTIGSVLRWATDDFRARGIPTPRLDAELLLGKVLGKDRVGLLVDSERTLTQDELALYRKLIVRRRRAEPVAYILGVREFYGLPISVDARVLVPRPETETLVEVALRRTAALHLGGDALDLCTGSGCVAIALARRRPTWRITGVDISEDALAVARRNAERLGAAWSVHFTPGDLDSALPPGAEFDLVTANPPYIPTAEIETLGPDVRDHEPRLALDGGADGLSLVRRIVLSSRARLRPGGILAMEVGHGQAGAVLELLGEAGLSDLSVESDLSRIERVVSARR